MKVLFYILLFCAPTITHAGDYVVFGVKTDIPLADNQAPVRDLYVSMGTNQGIKVGSKLDAYRVLTTVDEIQQKTGRNFQFKIARLKVIHAETDMAVVRVVDMLPVESTPIGLYTNVMVGDQVQVSSK